MNSTQEGYHWLDFQDVINLTAFLYGEPKAQYLTLNLHHHHSLHYDSNIRHVYVQTQDHSRFRQPQVVQQEAC